MNITYFSFINTQSLKLPEDFVGLDLSGIFQNFLKRDKMFICEECICKLFLYIDMLLLVILSLNLGAGIFLF